MRGLAARAAPGGAHPLQLSLSSLRSTARVGNVRAITIAAIAATVALIAAMWLLKLDPSGGAS